MPLAFEVLIESVHVGCRVNFSLLAEMNFLFT